MAAIREDSNTPPTEESPLQPVPPRKVKRSDIFLIYSTFLGVFIASADEFVVLSTYTTIASEFHRLSEGSWLLVAYNFGYCISLPVCGTLSDLYGRKNVLLTSYGLFLLGCVASAGSGSLFQLVLARVLAGASGAGMVALVSIVIMDLVPPREVAMYRSYENVMSVIGRSLGVPIGGLLSDTVGWRWTFWGQIPFILFCTLVGIYALPGFRHETEVGRSSEDSPSGSCLRDIDFTGLITFSATIVTFLLLLRAVAMEGDNKAFHISSLFLGLLLFGTACIATELFWARKPLIPVHLLLKELGLYCLIQILFHSGRTALVVNIIPYFIRVEGASDFLSSMMYVQVAVGVSVGGVISSLIIKRTGRYKTMAVTSLIITILSFLLIFLIWSDGCELWESSILFFVGFAPGILFSSLFIGMSNSSATDCIASCIGTFYLSQQLGIIVGSACGSALIQGLFKMNLAAQMEGTSYWKDFHNILNDAKFSQTLPPPEQELVKSSYLASFQYVPLFAAVTTLTTLPIFLCLKEKRLE